MRGLHEVRKHNAVLERARNPDQVQRVLVDADLRCQRARVVAAQPRAAVGVDADAEVADPGLERGSAHEILDRACHARVHLRRVVHGRIGFVVQRDEEDVGY